MEESNEMKKHKGIESQEIKMSQKKIMIKIGMRRSKKLKKGDK